MTSFLPLNLLAEEVNGLCKTKKFVARKWLEPPQPFLHFLFWLGCFSQVPLCDKPGFASCCFPSHFPVYWEAAEKGHSPLWPPAVLADLHRIINPISQHCWDWGNEAKLVCPAPVRLRYHMQGLKVEKKHRMKRIILVSGLNCLCQNMPCIWRLTQHPLGSA